MPDLKNMVRRASRGARALALAGAERKNQALRFFQQELLAAENDLIAANQKDLEHGAAAGIPPHLLDRLSLTSQALNQLAEALNQVEALPDPVGSMDGFQRLASGLEVGKLRIPLGLIAFICEARPGAVVEAASLTLKSGNGLLVKSGKEMARTAEALSQILALSLEKAGLPTSAVTVLPTLEREALKEILAMDDLVDLVIPRGGEGLIRFVAENSRIPVLKHYRGVCHLYVDRGADLDMARDLIVNAKTQRPSTCNSLEALLVHEAEAAALLPGLNEELKNRGCTLLASPEARPYLPGAAAAAEADWGREFLDLTLAVRLVPDFQAALDHIARYGSRHTEAIVTRDHQRALDFLRSVDAGCVMVNASTRLNDGGCLGLGAEIGISTTKIHAYGPMGLKDLTTTKFVVLGQGHKR